MKKNNQNNFLRKTLQKCKHTVVVISLMLSGTIIRGQISNPSFEILKTTNDYPTDKWQTSKIKDWVAPTLSPGNYYYGAPPNTIDYRMNISATGSTPFNSINAQNGNAYMSLIAEAAYQNSQGTGYSNYKEYLTTKLGTKLSAGVTYKITFYTMHLYGRSTLANNENQLVDFPAAEKGYLGLCFSAVAPNSSNTSANTGAIPQGYGGILNSWNKDQRVLIPATNTQVYDNHNTWVPVTLNYTANGTEEYMTVGQWREDPTTLTRADSPNTPAVYYLYDNFEIVNCPTIITSQPNSTPQNICVNGTATPLTVTASGTAPTYQWYYSDAATGGNITTVTGATSSSYTPDTGIVGTRYYYVIVTDGTCSNTSTRTQVTVNSGPTLTGTGASNTNDTKCQNVAATAIALTSNVTSKFEWYSNSNNTTTGGTLVKTTNSATSDNYTPPTTTAGTMYYYAVVTNTSTGCSTKSGIRTQITTAPPSITTQPDSTPRSYCQNQSSSTVTPLTVTANGAGTLSYQWYVATTPSGTGSSVGSTNGGQTASYTPPTSSTPGTYYYYVIVSGTCAPTATSNKVSVTINPNPGVPAYSSTTSATQTVCQNTTPINLVASASGASSYQWYNNGTTNSTSGGTAITGATGTTYTPPTDTAGTTYYYVVATTSSGCSTTATSTRGVIVNAAPVINPQPNSTAQNLCVGQTANTLTASATGSGTLTYLWRYSDAPTGGTIANAPGTNNNTSYTPPTGTAHNTRYYFVEVTSSTTSCKTSSSPRTPVTVSAYPTAVSASPASQSLAYNATPANLTATATGATSYQWYTNTAATNSGGTPISGATNSAYTPPTNVAGTQYYYVVALNGGNCGTASNAVQVTVSACPAGNTAPTVNTAVGNNCPATTVNLNTQAHTGTIPANTQLRWFTDNNHTTAVSTPTAVGGGTYFAFYYSSSSNCYSPASQAVTVAISPCQSCSVTDPVPVNLATFSPPAGPNGSLTEWHSSANPSAATKLSSTVVNATYTATSYWVYYHDTTNNCYSPGSKVTVVSNSCCNYPTVDLTALPQTAAPSGSSVVWYTTKTHDSGTQVNNPTAVGNGKYWPFYYDGINGCFSPAGTPVLVAVDNVCDSKCYRAAATGGTTQVSTHGISALGRATNGTNVWPGARKGAWTVLESKEKGFVINRVATTAGLSAITNPVEGMIVYDEEALCLKVYTSKDNGSTYGWYCMTTPACPDN